MKALKHSNSKLGNGIFSWSIPPVTTCPGRSESCSKACYAMAGHYHHNNVKASLKASLDLYYRGAMVSSVLHDIRNNCIAVVRIHVAGDFFSDAYVRQWIDIVSRARHVRFFAYTRSWRRRDHGADLNPAMATLASLPNMNLWMSCDAETGVPDRMPNTRLAYMSVSDADTPTSPVDLIFRVNDRTPMRFSPRGDLVCPFEQGNPRIDITCAKCKMCLRDQPVPKGSANMRRSASIPLRVLR